MKFEKSLSQPSISSSLKFQPRNDRQIWSVRMKLVSSNGIVNFRRIYSSSWFGGKSASETIGRPFASIKSLPRRASLSLCNRNDGGQKLSPVFSISPGHNSGPSRFMGDVLPRRTAAPTRRENAWKFGEKGNERTWSDRSGLVFPEVCKGEDPDSRLKAY